jgi:hypothetical protein
MLIVTDEALALGFVETRAAAYFGKGTGLSDRVCR